MERLVIEPGIGLDSDLVPMLRWPDGAESLIQPVVVKLAENGSDCEQVIEFRVTYHDKSNPSNVALPGFNPKARLRRILAEGRDRLQPLVRWG